MKQWFSRQWALAIKGQCALSGGRQGVSLAHCLEKVPGHNSGKGSPEGAPSSPWAEGTELVSREARSWSSQRRVPDTGEPDRERTRRSVRPAPQRMWMSHLPKGSEATTPEMIQNQHSLQPEGQNSDLMGYQGHTWKGFASGIGKILD